MGRRKGERATPELKAEAARLVLDEGLTARRVAADLDVGYQSLLDWVRREKLKRNGPEDSDAAKQIAVLKEKVRILQMERDILKKAAVFFAKEER
jgi:transposase